MKDKIDLLYLSQDGVNDFFANADLDSKVKNLSYTLLSGVDCSPAHREQVQSWLYLLVSSEVGDEIS